MNFGLVFRLLGVIAFTLAVAFLICLGTAFLPSPIEAETKARTGFAVCAGLALIVSILFFLAGRKSSHRLFRKEALCVIGLGWLLASILGALPYFIIDAGMSLVDAFFESASGLTTTGASVYADVEVLPRSLLFWRGLSQWLGGMGVVVFFVAILGFLGAGAKILYSNEASGSTADFDEPRVQAVVLNLWLIYVGLSAACTLAFIIGGMSTYDAVCHMFAAVSTGGFSTRNASFAAFDSAFLDWSAIVFMVLGGTSFLLIGQATRRRFGSIRRNTEIRAYLFILGLCTVAIAASLLLADPGRGVHDAVRSAAFQVVSIMTTTGFASEDFDRWQVFPKVILLALMFVGGCSASTSGGIKVARLVVALRILARSVELEFRRHVLRRIHMNGKPVEDETASEVLTFLTLAGVTCLLGVPLAAMFEPGLSLEATMSSVFACLFNVGPGFGEVGPTLNYASLHDFTKFLLAILMIMGRLEFYAILVLFSPALWRKFR